MSYFFVALRTICVQMDAAKGYPLLKRVEKRFPRLFFQGRRCFFFGAFGSVGIKDGECGVSVALVKFRDTAFPRRFHPRRRVVAATVVWRLRIPSISRAFVGTFFQTEPQEYDGEVLWLAPARTRSICTIHLRKYRFVVPLTAGPSRGRLRPRDAPVPHRLRRGVRPDRARSGQEA